MIERIRSSGWQDIASKLDSLKTRLYDPESSGVAGSSPRDLEHESQQLLSKANQLVSLIGNAVSRVLQVSKEVCEAKIEEGVTAIDSDQQDAEEEATWLVHRWLVLKEEAEDLCRHAQVIPIAILDHEIEHELAELNITPLQGQDGRRASQSVPRGPRFGIVSERHKEDVFTRSETKRGDTNRMISRLEGLLRESFDAQYSVFLLGRKARVLGDLGATDFPGFVESLGGTTLSPEEMGAKALLFFCMSGSHDGRLQRVSPALRPILRFLHEELRRPVDAEQAITELKVLMENAASLHECLEWIEKHYSH